MKRQTMLQEDQLGINKVLHSQLHQVNLLTPFRKREQEIKRRPRHHLLMNQFPRKKAKIKVHTKARDRKTKKQHKNF